MIETKSQKHTNQTQNNDTHGKGAIEASQERGQIGKSISWLRYHVFNLLFFFYPGAVSKVHQQEATEKYWILLRNVEILYNSHADRLGLNGTTSLPHDPSNIDKFVQDETSRIEEKWSKQPPASKEESEASQDPDSTDKSNLKLLLHFYKILIKDRKKLTRREGDLNILWRDLTFIRTHMLTTAGILPSQQLPFQLDYCRGEAIRLGAQSNEELQELIIDAASELDNIDSSSPQKAAANNRTIRNIVRIITRLNNKRLQRVHEQRMNKLMYQTAFSIFLLLSCILLYAHEHVLAPAKIYGKNETKMYAQGVAEQDSRKTLSTRDSSPQSGQTTTPTETNNTSETEPLKVFNSFKSLLLVIHNFIVQALDLCKNYMKINPLFFIFFAGLTGGFLSTVMRLGKRPSNLLPGDDAYYAWYVLTKPVVGAFAAVIFYVIVQANVVPVEIFSKEYLQAIIDEPVGAKGFSFGCIMGFSERIIMPKVT